MRFLLALCLLFPAVAFANCGPAAAVAPFLKDNFGETPQATFKSPDVTYTLYGGKDGWTLVGVRGDTACILSEGKTWTILNGL